jgi:hypothetical protein
MAITQENLDNWFQYHAPGPGDAEAYQAIRAAGKVFAEVILANTPPSADQTVAIRTVREAVYIANASRACGGK